jgi:DNA-binding transcriptional LysR family regulator
VATWDALTFALLPGLIARAATEAPNVQLDVRPVPREGSDVGLEDGSIDLVVEVRPPERVGLKQRTLYEDSFVCLVREGHPAVGERLDLETYLALSHALISPQGEGTGVVDRCLAERGLTRRIALKIRYFLVAPLVVARSDLVLTCPRSLAEGLRGLAPLRLLAPPAELDLAPFRAQMFWHERAEQDPAHRWLREAVTSVLRR